MAAYRLEVSGGALAGALNRALYSAREVSNRVSSFARNVAKLDRLQTRLYPDMCREMAEVAVGITGQARNGSRYGAFISGDGFTWLNHDLCLEFRLLPEGGAYIIVEHLEDGRPDPDFVLSEPWQKVEVVEIG